MQSIFDKFSLQNLLRQFFCGFVFISSFCFFASGNATDDLTWSKLEGLSKGIPLELSWLIILAVAATIIGTIIYHLEKNLYSYSIQALFEGIDSCCNSSQKRQRIIKRWLIGIVGVIVLLLMLTLLCLSCPLLFLLLIIPFIAWLCMFSQVIERTQKIWIIETGTAKLSEEDDKGDLKFTHSDRKAIAQKLATWSDFIHCTQSCCFAWIVGCVLADGWCTACKEPSVRIAISILLLELLFDWHRYQHVLDITKPQVPSPANKEKQLDATADAANSANTDNN